MKRIEQSILSGQNISSNFLCHTYTADIEREIYGQIFISAITITGSSTRSAWITAQIEGSGTACVGVPITDGTMVTGTTINGIMFNSMPIPVYAGDVVKFYVRGTAADTSARVQTRVFDMNSLRPTTTDRTLDVTAAGEVNANVTAMAADVITASALAASAVAEISDGDWDELLAGHAIPGSAGAALSAAGAASDPLLNAVPGTYLGGTAGAALGRIGSGQISTTSIVAQSGDVTTYRGDDYNNTDARRIEWTDASASWPTLTAATILVVIGGDISFAGTVITATGTSKKVGLELTATQTLTIPQGVLDFVVVATLASGRVVTLVDGKWTSKKQLVVGS